MTSKKTPVRVMISPSAAEVAEAAKRENRTIPMAKPLDDPPCKMVMGRPGSDEARKNAKAAMVAAGYTVRSCNHTPAGEVLVYLMNPADQPVRPQPRAPRSSIPRRVR